MAVCEIKAVLACDIQTVWEMVTSLEHYTWRSDLDKIEVTDENQFIEYTREGYATAFTVTVKEPCRRWEFDMENDNMKGHFSGVFIQKDHGTEIRLTEDVTAKKVFMKPVIKSYLKKQQARYVADLKKAVSMEEFR